MKKNSDTVVRTNGKIMAKAFVNWGIPLKDGSIYKGDKGFPIFQNPEYPSAGEDLLVKLATENDGSVDLIMNINVRLNNKTDKAEITLADLL